MADMVQPVAQPAGGLSEGERVIDTFIAPGKTFADIRRKATWWLPFLIMALLAIPYTYAVDKKVGFDDVAEKQMMKNHFQADRINSLPADQKAVMIHKSAVVTKMSTYASAVFLLLFALIISLLWWLSTNFALGGQTTYWQILAIWMYSSLPKIFIYLLATVLLFAGVGTENFDLQNPAATNLGYFLPNASPAIRAAASFIDIFSIWSLVLATMGIAIVARKTKGQAAAVVFGWWILGMILTTAAAAIFS